MPKLNEDLKALNEKSENLGNDLELLNDEELDKVAGGKATVDWLKYLGKQRSTSSNTLQA